ncbi:MAG: hypothetical protein GY847_20005 [Proteobacteria bacterium]|nr:hypothetical protein [Pseudomonadota bacterium]
MTSHTITALVERRREIMREQAWLQGEASNCDRAIKAIDQTILLFDPLYDFAGLKPKKPVTEDEIFRPGEAPILALDTLRETGKPLSTTEITQAMLVKRGEPRLSRKQFETLNRKINSALNTKFRQGVVRKAGRVQGSNRAVIWELIY